MQKKSRGVGYQNLGSVVAVGNEGIVLYSVTVSGNYTDIIDFFGGVDDNNSGSAPGNVEALEYDTINNRTKIIYNYTSQIFSVGETVYYSPDRGLSAGTYLSRIRFVAQVSQTTYGNQYSATDSVHVFVEGAKSTASETYRLQGQVDRVNNDFTPTESRYSVGYSSFTGSIGYNV